MVADGEHRRCELSTFAVHPMTIIPKTHPTAARKAGVLDPRQQLGERDRLSAGGKRIRTIGPPPEIVVDD
jgi:hypothetical protein